MKQIIKKQMIFIIIPLCILIGSIGYYFITTQFQGTNGIKTTLENGLEITVGSGYGNGESIENVCRKKHTLEMKIANKSREEQIIDAKAFKYNVGSIIAETTFVDMDQSFKLAPNQSKNIVISFAYELPEETIETSNREDVRETLYDISLSYNDLPITTSEKNEQDACLVIILKE